MTHRLSAPTRGNRHRPQIHPCPAKPRHQLGRQNRFRPLQAAQAPAQPAQHLGGAHAPVGKQRQAQGPVPLAQARSAGTFWSKMTAQRKANGSVRTRSLAAGLAVKSTAIAFSEEL